jgi:DNA-binding NtrC family response regulator
LAEHFVRIHSQQLGKQVTSISASMLEKMEAYPWPGNVRQLEGVIQRALISATGDSLDLVEGLEASGTADERNSAVDLRGMEKEHIEKVLRASNWMIAGDGGAAIRLGLPPSTLRSKMKKLGITRPRGVV